MQASLVILGCNSALPTSDRFSTAQVLHMLGRSFLIDCGEGTQILLRKNKIKFSAIDHVFISHLHGDHYLGIFGLISSFNLLGRKKVLNIYGPKELEEIVLFQIKHLEHTLLFKIQFHQTNPLSPGIIYEDKLMTVSVIPMNHRIPTCGFIFREKERAKNIKKECIETYNLSIKDILKIKQGYDFITESGECIPNESLTTQHPQRLSYAFCTDTLYDESIVNYVKNVDLLYHESTFTQEYAKRAKETFHSTAKQAATIAKLAQVKKLAIGHYSARIHHISSFLKEAIEVFPETVAVTDGMVIPFG